MRVEMASPQPPKSLRSRSMKNQSANLIIALSHSAWSGSAKAGV